LGEGGEREVELALQLVTGRILDFIGRGSRKKAERRNGGNGCKPKFGSVLQKKGVRKRFHGLGRNRFGEFGWPEKEAQVRGRKRENGQQKQRGTVRWQG